MLHRRFRKAHRQLFPQVQNSLGWALLPACTFLPTFLPWTFLTPLPNSPLLALAGAHYWVSPTLLAASSQPPFLNPSPFLPLRRKGIGLDPQFSYPSLSFSRESSLIPMHSLIISKLFLLLQPFF